MAVGFVASAPWEWERGLDKVSLTEVCMSPLVPELRDGEAKIVATRLGCASGAQIVDDEFQFASMTGILPFAKTMMFRLGLSSRA
jgi:hypothetical protein